jgi:AAA domain
MELACGSRALVVIEGHAGTGKSTALTGIARAHQGCGRQIIVTSTAALSAELLGDPLAPILATPGVPELLAPKASQGCNVSILLADPSRYLMPFVDQPGIQIRVLEVPVRYAIHRFGEQLLLTLNLLDQDPEHAPLQHIRRAAPEGLFDRGRTVGRSRS